MAKTVPLTLKIDTTPFRRIAEIAFQHIPDDHPDRQELVDSVGASPIVQAITDLGPVQPGSVINIEISEAYARDGVLDYLSTARGLIAEKAGHNDFAVIVSVADHVTVRMADDDLDHLDSATTALCLELPAAVADDYAPRVQALIRATRTIPFAWCTEDGDTWWAEGHWPAHTMLLAVIIEQITVAETDPILISGLIAGTQNPHRDLGTGRDVLAKISELAHAAVSHVWMVPIDDERWDVAEEGADGACAFTRYTA